MAHFGFCTIRREGAARTAVLGGDRVTDLAALAVLLGAPAPPDTVRMLLADWDRWCDLAEAAAEKDLLAEASVDRTEVSFLPPAADPPATYCAGANYRDHIREMGSDLTSRPGPGMFHFLASPAALTGHRRPVRRPPGCTKLDWEIELAVVVGRRASHITPEEVPARVAGYTIANDVSVREFASRRSTLFGIDWIRHKSFSTLIPIGPPWSRLD